jgi:ubiquinone/menaquinone biosynthesis C-methylase UbiE
MTDVPSTDQTVFLRGWQTYRKVLDNNYMFHREVYECLRQVILRRAPKLFRFLDIACGDASASVRALAGTPIGHYYGIDISGPALAIAKEELAVINCPVTLAQSDFVEAISRWKEPVDVVWIGQSLHHLEAPAKRELMRSVRHILSNEGLFLIWEPTLFDGELQEGWISRFESGSRPLWLNLVDEEWNAMLSHVRASDHAETSRKWQQLGLEAGFRSAAELYTAPTKLARIYCFDGAA